MGWRYVFFRIWYEFQIKTGLLKRKFPTNPEIKTWASLENWRKSTPQFFFESREKLFFPKTPSEALKAKFEKNIAGIFTFFSSLDFELGTNYDWVTNPDNHFNYPLDHWTQIQDFSKVSGDIKYVWEKSRFSYLYTVIRYDYHFEEDHSEFVFSEIQSWIRANPVNQGPNWRCSQEISLRVLNWTYALFFYKNSKNLSDDLFNQIMNSIYWQMSHVYANINFSRIAVRNNHAITETLALYLVGLLLPHFPESNTWKKNGKAWFEEEIAYQVYEDGTFLQFSMNYHRVVVQLLTWALVLSKKNGEEFSDFVDSRAKKSLDFLMICQDDTSGQLPNYGANDGALFFPLNEADFRDYRPQLNALYFYFNEKNYCEAFEDSFWYFCENTQKVESKIFRGKFSFEIGGYYLFKEQEVLTFIRCGNHKDRPSQADNLHLDIWVKGENILRDGGSYKYNTDEETIRYFIGTQSHNTVMLGNYDQMKKGPRFIWYDWSQTKSAQLTETNQYFEFIGAIEAFKEVGKNIIHKRVVRKYKQQLKWEITDEITNNCDLPLVQIWNPNENFQKDYIILAKDENGNVLIENELHGWYSGYYGKKENTQQIKFYSNGNKIVTKIENC